MTERHTSDQSERELALAGNERAFERLVDRLTPVVQARVARILLRHGKGRRPEGIHQVVEDLIQDVFVRLFDDDAQVLRDWRPERGLSLANFVGLVAERRALAVLRSARCNPWTEEPTELADLDSQSRQAGPEESTASREGLRILLARFKEELSPLGWRIFELLFLFDRSVQEVGRETHLSTEAVYTWRSRLRRRARALYDELATTKATTHAG